ncbi:MAG: 2,3-bisphosphoglycerate-independent phosphoglycerate mutase [Candidatus Heteroscillospira sp.]|jgi:2,3-bisphosphoglycerate-independent phosphoglycerate mutase
MKYILIIGDGMADNSVPELGGLTPLEKASIPHIDAMASAGEVGSVRNVPETLPPGSDTAILSIMGCDTEKVYSGRAPLEAAAQGIVLEKGAAAFRCNNVSLSDGGSFGERRILSHSGGNIEGSQSRELMEYLFSHPDFAPLAAEAGMTIAAADSYRHLAFRKNADIRGIRLAPPHDHLEERAGDNLPSGCADAAILTRLMEAAVPILEKHPINLARRAEGKLPANAIWFWAEGTAVQLEDFYQKFGRTGAMISAVPLCRGIARLLGLEVIEVPGATGELDTNYAGKVEAALKALETKDFAVIHIEAPDECTHCHDLAGKIQAIEWLDSRVAAPLNEALKGQDYRLLLLSDHKTLMADGSHDGDVVPYLIYDSRRDHNSGAVYTEAQGLLGETLSRGEELLPRLFGL